MENNIPKFTIAHVGINHPDEESAANTAKRLCMLLGLEYIDEPRHIFVGNLFEVKKHINHGTIGHIALKTDDVEATIEHLKEKGIGIDEDTIRRNDAGEIVYAYLDVEIAGFGFHLMQE